MMTPSPLTMAAAMIVLLAGCEATRCFAATTSSQIAVSVNVGSSCEAAGLCGLADVHELNEPAHVSAGLPMASDARASVAQLPVSGEGAVGSRIVVHELDEPGHLPAILPKAPVAAPTMTASRDRLPRDGIAVRDRQVEVDF